MVLNFCNSFSATTYHNLVIWYSAITPGPILWDLISGQLLIHFLFTDYLVKLSPSMVEHFSTQGLPWTENLEKSDFSLQEK
jgi:hypothetical protein